MSGGPHGGMAGSDFVTGVSRSDPEAIIPDDPRFRQLAISVSSVKPDWVRKSILLQLRAVILRVNEDES